jgi:hypothetical protein
VWYTTSSTPTNLPPRRLHARSPQSVELFLTSVLDRRFVEVGILKFRALERVQHVVDGRGDSRNIRALLPLSNGMQRRVFVPTASEWTASFQNGIEGSDPFPAKRQVDSP